MLKYKEGSLFEADKGTILVHACNTMGVWGSGIAAEFKKRFPYSFLVYNELCKNALQHDAELYGLSGTTLVTPEENGYKVGCLFTSADFGKDVDPVDEILVNTTLALHYFVGNLTGKPKIASNMFNSGLFGVPWDRSEAALKVFVDRYDLDWTVYVPKERNV